MDGLLPLGLIRGLPADDYHDSPGISQSALKTFAEPGGPAKYRAGVRKDTASLKFGGVLHTATLEPHLLEEQYCPTQLDREGTKAWVEAELKAGGRILVKQKEWDQARYMRDSLLSHPTISQLLTAIETEVSMYWIDQATGMLCRGRLDGLNLEHRFCIDIKSTTDASPDGFGKSCSEWGYDWQESHYRTGFQRCEGYPIDDFIFIPVEKDPPYLAACYTIPKMDVEEAGRSIHDAMRYLQACREADDWPGYDPGIREISLPYSRRRRLAY